MKKLLLAFTLFLTACGVKEVKTEKSVLEDSRQYKNIQLITVDNLIDKMNKKENFTFVVLSKYCHACNDFKNYIETKKLKEKIFYIDVANKQEKVKLIKLLDLYGTPTFIVFKNGKVEKQILGFKKETLEEIVKK